MEKSIIICPHCGQPLARLLGEAGQRQRLHALGGSRVRTIKNAMGEQLPLIKCPKCKKEKFINPAR